MSKLNKNSIFLSAGILVIAMFGVMILPITAKAYTTDYDHLIDRSYSKKKVVEYSPIPAIYSINPNPVIVGSDTTRITINGGSFVYGAVAKINNSDRTTTFFNEQTLLVELISSDTARQGDYVITVYNPGPGGGLSNGYIFSVKNQTTVVTPAPVTKAPAKKTPTTTAKKDTGNGLVAGAIYGDNGFLPSGLIQWLILAILILLLIIVIRKLYGEEKYHQTPLKHA